MNLLDHPVVTAGLAALLALALVLLVAAILVVRRVSDATTTSESLTPEQLPRALREAIDRSEPSFRSAGFRHAADLRTRRRGVSCLARYYLSRDERAMAEIAVHTALGFPTGGVAFALTSLLDDGTVVQSTHHDSLPEGFSELSEDDKVLLNAAGTDDPAELSRRHVEYLEEKRGRERRPARITPEFIPQLNAYTYQVCDWYLHRTGVLPEPPPRLT